MNIDPQLLAYYAQVAATYSPISDPAASVRRARNKEIANRYAPSAPQGVQIEAIDVPFEGRTLRSRLYRPEAIQEPLPLIVYFHGGGWVFGDLDTHEQVPAGLALDAGAAVASIEYRLSPEHPFPAPIDDALDALLWYAENRLRLGLATRPMAVAGDSAGAFLATYAARVANDTIPGLVKAQLLLYPVVHPGLNTPSYETFANGPGLTRADMAWFWSQFLGEEIPTSGAGVPWMTDSRAHQAAVVPEHTPADAIVMVAGTDPLKDEGVDYARFLQAHGGDVELIEASDMTHGFARMQHISNAAHDWMQRAGLALREML